jgi:hypothetical protein
VPNVVNYHTIRIHTSLLAGNFLLLITYYLRGLFASLSAFFPTQLSRASGGLWRLSLFFGRCGSPEKRRAPTTAVIGARSRVLLGLIT